MGDPLRAQLLEAFSDELQKEAQGEAIKRLGRFLIDKGLRNPTKFSLRAVGKIGRGSKGIVKGVEESAHRLFHPIQGLKEGWRMSSPLPAMEQRAKEMGFGSAMEAAKALKGTNAKSYKEMLGGGEHLLGTAPGTGKIRSVAEGLSRGGWTGAGRLTKYLPVGNKGLTVGFAGVGIPSVVHAEKPSQVGEGSTLERGLGELASAGGMILGTGVGIVPGSALWYIAQKSGSRLGRVLDRMRAGAPARKALTAPSPSEAAEQLESIQKYYG